MQSRGDPAIKLVVLGNGSVGKSSLIARFVADGFARVYKQTIGLDFYEKTLAFPRDQRVVLQVWDIGGQTTSSKMISKYLYGVHVALVCYDVTDAQSFSDAEDWVRVARSSSSAASGDAASKQAQTKAMQLYLVGNKIDLIAHRVIQKDKHDAFVRAQQLDGGFLVSAQNGDNVVKAVYRISATAAKLQVSDAELAFCDKVVRATVPARGSGADDDEGRTAMADAIEAEDRALEAKKAKQKEAAASPARCLCCVM